MAEFFQWFVDPNNGRTFVLILFFIAYSGVLLYLYSGKKRSKRLESYKNIPFQDDEGEEKSSQRKENEHE